MFLGHLAYLARRDSAGLRKDYTAWRPNVERAVAQVATFRGRRLKLRYRGVTKNHAWHKRRTALATCGITSPLSSGKRLGTRPAARSATTCAGCAPTRSLSASCTAAVTRLPPTA